MDCRRAFEIELGAFLRDPRRPEWDEFRAHYPRCAACAAEVRAHTEVALLLAPAHPDPERLLLLEDEPAALDAGERATLENHVAGCVTCRDELAALRHFAPAPALVAAAAAPQREAASLLRVVETSPQRAAAAGPPRAATSPRRRPLARIGRLLWQPGVAWAAVLVLAMYSTLGPDTRSLFERTIPQTAEMSAPPPRRARRVAPAPVPPAARGKTAESRPPAATESAVPPVAPAPPPSERPAPSRGADVAAGTGAAAQTKRPLAQRPQQSEGKKTRSDDRAAELGKDEAAPSEQQPRFAEEGRLARQPHDDEAAAAKSLGSLADSVAKEDGVAPIERDEQQPPSSRGAAAPRAEQPPSPRTAAAPRAEPAAPPPPPPAPALEAKGKLSALATSQRLAADAEAPTSTATLVPTADGLAKLELVVPNLPNEVDVELRTSDGRRRLTERATRSAPSTLSISLPADWLGAGPYDVDIRDPSGRLLYTTRIEARR